MTIFMYFGMFLFVGGLLLFAVISIRLPGFATGRMVLGAVVALISLSGMIKAQTDIAKKEQAFKRGDWATATVVRAIGGLHALPVVTLRVHGPDCEFEQTEQVTYDFKAISDCVPDAGCATGKVVRVALGDPPCSIAYADPRGGVLARQLVTWAGAIAALAGLVFIGSGLHHRRNRPGGNINRKPG
jgi:hypothetical protein